jgi:hypothetical protein
LVIVCFIFGLFFPMYRNKFSHSHQRLYQSKVGPHLARPMAHGNIKLTAVSPRCKGTDWMHST